MSFTSDLENTKQTVRLLVRILIATFILLILVITGWMSVQNKLTIYYPPDLRSGAVMKRGEIPDADVYLFAQYIMQQLNSWPKNGATNYPANISRLRFFLTPLYQQELRDDVKKRNSHGELRQRIRSFRSLPGHPYTDDDVKKLGNAWLVWIDARIVESVLGQTVKDIKLRYPIRVVRYDTNREMNPWGLALDGSGNYDATNIESRKK